MKLFQLPLKIALVLIWFLVAVNQVRSQSGNMSDITLPNPGEVTPDTSGEDLDTSDGQVSTGEETDTPETDVAAEEGQTPDSEVGAAEETDPASETPTEEAVAGDGETSGEDVNVDGGDVVDDGIAEGKTADENVRDAIADGDDTPETEVVAEESPSPDEDNSGVNLSENTAGDSGITTEDNAVPDVAETPSESTVEADSNLNTESENNTSQSTPETTEETTSDSLETDPVAEDSLEVETSQETTSDSTEVTEETTTDSTEVTETGTVTEDSTEVEIAEETTTDSTEVTETNTVTEDSTEVEIAEETTTDSTEVTETNTVTEDSTEVETTEETTSDSNEVAEDTTEADVVAEDTSEAKEATKEKLTDELAEEAEENDTTATEETEETETAEGVSEETEEAEVSQETEEETEETETTEESEEEEKVAEDDNNPQDLGQEVDRIAYEALVQESPTHLAIQMQEELQLTQLMDTSGLQLYGQVPSVKDISRRLAELGEQTGKNPAFINISLQSNQLEAFVVLPDETKSSQSEESLLASRNLNKIDSSATPQAVTVRETVKDTSRKDLMAIATQFREEVSDSSKLSQSSYLESAQQLYQVLIEPIEDELEANNIDILVFSMDSGLRLLPLAALHDGEQFLIEKYAVALVPSFGLTDTRYVNLDRSSILAMGASEFTEQAALPTMPIELEAIVSQPRQGEIFINEQFTISNFKAQNSRQTPFPIVHLGTHAEFKAGHLNDSYIQFYDDKLKIPQLQDLSNELGWNSDATPVELLVLSACETALGDENAELGFAGLAVQAGVKSALASLWYVSDVGTLALMGEFYDRLSDTLIKAEALRQTQLEMLEGNVKVSNKQVKLSNGQNLSLPPEFPDGTLALSHPYFWSAFTLIGNWN
ncbi:MAG: CHAT domain-containing protein [Pleurocapsa sp. MO_226.B13]|nr:CHAT domain-containing protein [Pleurocapsa sp. MO_226.B13]